MNIFNVEKKSLDGNCRICGKDFSTKFDGKTFRSQGVVCHENCIVHSPALRRDPEILAVLDIPVTWRDIRKEGDRCEKLICALCKGSSANLGCELCPTKYHYLCGFLRGCKSLTDCRTSKSFCWKCVNETDTFPKLFAKVLNNEPRQIKAPSTPGRPRASTSTQNIAAPIANEAAAGPPMANKAAADSIIEGLVSLLGRRNRAPFAEPGPSNADSPNDSHSNDEGVENYDNLYGSTVVQRKPNVVIGATNEQPELDKDDAPGDGGDAIDRYVKQESDVKEEAPGGAVAFGIVDDDVQVEMQTGNEASVKDEALDEIEAIYIDEDRYVKQEADVKDEASGCAAIGNVEYGVKVEPQADNEANVKKEALDGNAIIDAQEAENVCNIAVPVEQENSGNDSKYAEEPIILEISDDEEDVQFVKVVVYEEEYLD